LSLVEQLKPTIAVCESSKKVRLLILCSTSVSEVKSLQPRKEVGIYSKQMLHNDESVFVSQEIIKYIFPFKTSSLLLPFVTNLCNRNMPTKQKALPYTWQVLPNRQLEFPRHTSTSLTLPDNTA
jgi:hypothetical protein